jgi:hypothetical protein
MRIDFECQYFAILIIKSKIEELFNEIKKVFCLCLIWLGARLNDSMWFITRVDHATAVIGLFPPIKICVGTFMSAGQAASGSCRSSQLSRAKKRIDLDWTVQIQDKYSINRGA